MVAHYGAAQITLHVRKSNRAAISLYRDTLGFEVHEVQKSYCELFASSGRARADHTQMQMARMRTGCGTTSSRPHKRHDEFSTICMCPGIVYHMRATYRRAGLVTPSEYF
jgi:peptide alpha-N-acetyltransferase